MSTKKKLLLSLAIIIIAIFAFLSVKFKNIGGKLEPYLIRLAKNENVNLSIEGLKLKFIGANAKQINTSVIFKNFFANIELQDPSLKVSLFKLIQRIYSGNLNSDFYGGKLSANCELSTMASCKSIMLDNISLASHPQLAGIGINSGLLSASVDNLRTDQLMQVDNINIKLTNLSIPNGIKLAPPIFDFIITVPSISNLNLELDGLVENSELIAKFKSDLNLAKFEGDFKSNQKTVKELNVDVELTDLGVKELGVFLPIISQGKLTSDVKKFKVIKNLLGYSWE